jgi:hypothetical protein
MEGPLRLNLEIHGRNPLVIERVKIWLKIMDISLIFKEFCPLLSETLPQQVSSLRCLFLRLFQSTNEDLFSCGGQG